MNFLLENVFCLFIITILISLIFCIIGAVYIGFKYLNHPIAKWNAQMKREIEMWNEYKKKRYGE